MDKINKKIGIVMTYFNRQYQLTKTLESINKQKNDDIFVVIIDDGSTENIIMPPVYFESIIIKIHGEKKWNNPEPVYNTGFIYLMENTTCEIIISQNAECYHVGEVIDYARKNTTLDNYITFGCYSLDHEKTFDPNQDLFKIIYENNHCAPSGQETGWYNHSVYRPSALEFCSSIHKDNLLKLNGYDERLSLGFGYGDDYLLYRIKLLNLNIDIMDDPFVVHQWHGYAKASDRINKLLDINKLFYNYLIEENDIRGKHLFTKDLS